MSEAPTSDDWKTVLSQRRRLAGSLVPAQIPRGPGVYAWIRDGGCVYLGKASNLRSRLSTHLATSLDLSRSTLRSWVAVRELGLERAYTRRRPSAMTPDQVRVVTAWIHSCELAWVETESAVSAAALESALLKHWRPPINAK